jgi:CheY-like chemotaxis protein
LISVGGLVNISINDAGTSQYYNVFQDEIYYIADNENSSQTILMFIQYLLNFHFETDAVLKVFRFKLLNKRHRRKLLMEDKQKILIIEDDIDLVVAIKRILESKGYNAIVAYDPDEGAEKLRQENPDLIILDVMFGSKGESTGFNFAQNLRLDKKFSSIPVLMLTAINLEKSDFKFSPETDGEYLPVDAFLDKPVHSEDLLMKVAELISLKVSKWRNWPEKGN